MVSYESFTLENGLKVIVHHDASTPVVAINILYNVGARDEDPDRTGFAHLFEHLMFGGSKNIPRYDEPLEMAGGENNAFTNNDFTNYYLTIPKQNMETGFWLESDRMLSLAFSKKSLDVQRNVVCEEFRQSYLNQPYGDVFLLLRELAYEVHPYRWSTIGKDISHIQNATMEDVKEFFHKYYCPNNAILVVAGDVSTQEIKELSEKWFGPIPRGITVDRNYPVEPKQTKQKTLKVERDVPFDALYKAYHCCARMDKEFYATDFLTDILSAGRSSRLYQRLIKDQPLFSEINAYITGDTDKGLLVVTGKPIKGLSLEDAEKAIDKELELICAELVSEVELQKVKNKTESKLVFSEVSVLDKAMNLANYEWLGNAAMINEEITRYSAVTRQEIQRVAKSIFKKSNSSVLYYLSKGQENEA